MFLKNIRLCMQFDGTKYHGWQIQKNAITIQELLENAIFKITGERVSVIGCGRTDAGVHAKGYVCNFKTGAKIPAEKFAYALNHFLPCDVVCIKSDEVPEDFHAAFSAKGKRYTYYVANSPFPDVFSHSWHYPYPLDLEKMKIAAKAFEGTHDFIGFAAAGFTVKTTVRTIFSATVTKDENIVAIDVCGNGFLYNMIRIITGTLCFVGSGKISPYDMEEIIASCDRTRAGVTAPAEGLFLSEVFYEE